MRKPELKTTELSVEALLQMFAVDPLHAVGLLTVLIDKDLIPKKTENLKKMKKRMINFILDNELFSVSEKHKSKEIH